MLHTINPEILFLKQEDVIKAGLLDMKQILAVTEKTYAMLGQGLIKNPPKTNTSIPDKENWQSFFNAMPCYRRRHQHRRHQVGGGVQEERHDPWHPLRHRHFHPE